jgi:hypothetical protein
MGVGIVKEADGREHPVSFSSINQNEQVVAVVGPGMLALEPARTTLTAEPGKTLELPVRITRGQGVEGAIKLELIVAEHMRGLSADPAVIPADQHQGKLCIRCAPSLAGQFNLPVTLRAVLVHRGRRITAEAKIDISP